MKQTSMKNRFTKSSLAAAVACVCFTYNTVADIVIEEIVVTANKREQNLQEIPTGITAMSGDMLEDRGITDSRDLDKIVPSMITGLGNRGEPTINIRGVGFNEVGSPGVAIHVDGVYQPRPAMGVIAQYDIERVEILRGPQSTLYGRNANGGVVNYLTQSPEDDFGGSVTLGIADYGQTKISGTINAPINNDWGVRLSLSSLERDDGFYENILPNGPDSGMVDHSYGGRLVIAGDINEDVSLKLTASFADEDANPNSTVVLAPSYGNPLLAGDPLPTGDFEIAPGGESTVESTNEAFSAIVNWSLSDDWSLTSISGYQSYELERDSDFDFLASQVTENFTTEESTTFTQEFNLSGSISGVDTVFGLFYMDDQAEYGTYFTFPNGFGPLPASNEPSLLTLVPTYDTTSVAVFTDATWNISDDLRLIGGIRYSEDEQHVGQDITAPGPPSACVPGTEVTIDVDGTSTIGRLGTQYDVSDNSNLYATYSQGLKTGGVNFRSGCQDVFEDEEITAYELGYKTRSDDGRLTANVTAFFYDYTDLQTQQIVGLAAAINNAPGAEVLGLEIDGVWIPDDHWTVSASLSLLDATYSEAFINTDAAIAPEFIAPPPAPGAPPVTQPVVVDVNGNNLNYAPEVSSNISVGYKTDPVLADGVLDLRVDVRYRSEVTLREFDNDADRTDPVTLVGVSAKWISASEDYSVRLFVDNLTDEAYYEYASASNLLGFAFATWNTPRQYGVEFNVNF